MCEIVIEDQVRIPGWVTDLKSFRRWADSDEFPDDGRISFLNGEVWVNMSREQVFSHTRVKSAFGGVLVPLGDAEELGIYLVDGALLSHELANFAHKPDGLFVSYDSLRTGRVTPLEGKRGGYVEIEGTPDMLLEIVSDSSVRKDQVRLRELYWKAGIPEYWLVDARGDKVQFSILRHTEDSYVAVPRRGGWQKSRVFGRSFRLTVGTDPLGHPKYTLEVR